MLVTIAAAAAAMALAPAPAERAAVGPAIKPKPAMVQPCLLGGGR